MKGDNKMNYKDAYYYLFNQLSALQEQLKELQIHAELICTASDGETEQLRPE